MQGSWRATHCWIPLMCKVLDAHGAFSIEYKNSIQQHCWCSVLYICASVYNKCNALTNLMGRENKIPLFFFRPSFTICETLIQSSCLLVPTAVKSRRIYTQTSFILFSIYIGGCWLTNHRFFFVCGKRWPFQSTSAQENSPLARARHV